MPVYRIYVEKKPPYAVEARAVASDLKTSLRLDKLEDVRILNRYDAQGISEADFALATPTVFSEPAVDVTSDALPALSPKERCFAVEFLPGQFDQRADSCGQCIQLLTQGERPTVRFAKVFIIKGQLTDAEFARLKAYLINPVESREASLDTFDTLDVTYPTPEPVPVLEGFLSLDAAGLAAFVADYGLAMDEDDIAFCQNYFRSEGRAPTLTEIRMIDTYWSDHCRHTTFLTTIDKVTIETDYINDTYKQYLIDREALYAGRRDKPITLMDLATIAAKRLKADGLLPDLDESEEINACSVKIKVDVDGRDEDWLLMFKNETHNHPTEIEPFGGAATCLGGAIRDPLSGRSYVYQAMRVTGAANPLVPVEDTINGKLPQRKITVGAASGYSSYGNQIGLATGHVSEIYHPGYAAKRMEIGAVIGAAPAENVVRERPVPGDVVILLGGKTGRDGCGGATGSSKSHTLESLESCGAEVQKGNPPEERKIQRLFRKPEVTRLIKRCNDFGAGGVSVAIGELADGLSINLDAVPKKYEGLDGTELAISESQERMAVVVTKENAARFMEEAGKENLEATLVAVVTHEPRLRMTWNGSTIVDLSRDFLNSNGAEKHTDVVIGAPKLNTESENSYTDTAEDWISMLDDLNICSQKGLVERFDSTIGAGTVLMPFGGAYQLTPSQAMAAKLPAPDGDTTTCSLMGWGFNPHLSEQSPYHGAIAAVIESIARVIAAGGSREHCWLTFQEYFERTQNNPARWGKPMAALLGAYKAQLELGCAAIGGKDSMSGTFENLDVPPTLVSFAVSTAKTDTVVSTEFKAAGSTVILLRPAVGVDMLPDFASVRAVFDQAEAILKAGRAKAVWAVSAGGIAEGLVKMAFGNRIGFNFAEQLSDAELFTPVYGSFIIELSGEAAPGEMVLGHTSERYELGCKTFRLGLETPQSVWERRLEPVFPCNISVESKPVQAYAFEAERRVAPAVKAARPHVLIPVFPGTNCEYDSARAFERAGAQADVLVIRNLTAAQTEESALALERHINEAQIVMLPGGFSGGDEPDGSGKFITALFRNPRVSEAVHRLLRERDGLMLGVCNGFQALIKLGLVPYGEIVPMRDDSPTLTFNTIGRHQSKMVTTRIASNKSPWLAGASVGDLHTVPISHGEGRFVATAQEIAALAANGQIATQYVDLSGKPTMDIRFNPNSSMDAVEGITSADGRVLGKMAHSERAGAGIGKNVPGDKEQHIFENGVRYFK